MAQSEIKLPWAETGWLPQAEVWITQQLEQRGETVTGPIEQTHVRSWSTVLRAPTESGFYYFKASAPVLAHEPLLTQALYVWRPDCVQTVLNVDPARAWMLMPDQSPFLRERIQSLADLVHWETILPVFAGLQQEMASRQADLLALGILDRRLAGLPAQFERLLEDRVTLQIDQPDGLTSAQYQTLTSLLSRYAEMCAQLAEFGLPETLHHDDLHDANIFFPDGRYLFSDWGESCLTHPFFTMLVTLRSIAYRFDLAYGSGENQYAFAPEILHLRDIYLSTWAAYGSQEKLLSAFSLAWRVAMVNRALTWHRVVSVLPEAERNKHAYAVSAWLQEFLDALSPEAKF